MTTIDDLAGHIQDLGLYARRNGAALVVPITRAEDPERPLYAVFVVNGAKLEAHAYSKGFKISDERRFEALAFCNRWNRDRVWPRVYVDGDGDLHADLAFYGEGLSPEFIKENFIRLFVRAVGDFFEAAAETFSSR